MFAPEMGMIRVLGWMGRYLVRVGFEGEFSTFQAFFYYDLLVFLFFWEANGTWEREKGLKGMEADCENRCRD